MKSNITVYNYMGTFLARLAFRSPMKICVGSDYHFYSRLIFCVSKRMLKEARSKVAIFADTFFFTIVCLAILKMRDITNIKLICMMERLSQTEEPTSGCFFQQSNGCLARSSFSEVSPPVIYQKY